MSHRLHFQLHATPDGPETVYFRGGLAFAQGAIFQNSTLELTRDDTHSVNFSWVATQLWPDKSVKWIEVRGVTSRSNLALAKFRVTEACAKTAIRPKRDVRFYRISDDEIAIQSSAFSILLADRKKAAFHIRWQNQDVPVSFNLAALAGYSNVDCSLSDWECSPVYYRNGNDLPDELEVELTFKLTPLRSRLSPLQLECKLTLIESLNSVKIETCLRNPNPAHHQNGTWDLGEANSCLITQFGLDIKHTASDVNLFTNTDKVPLVFAESAKIWQRSSAGKNWQSPVHVDANNQVLEQVCGAQVIVDSVVKNLPTRCNPQIKLTNDACNIFLSPRKFWQNFPCSLSVDTNMVSLAFFAATTDNPIELQPGEQKSHQCILSFEQPYTADNYFALIVNEPTSIETSRCLPFFTANSQRDPLQSIINLGLDEEHGFYAKREAIDEYGWRHFGDLYADHETAEYSGDVLFPSHYNNQYDPLYGFLRQWLLTGDARWYELADDLAQHIMDIDIYHTDDDKPDYNHGLFWHTDHYLPAATCTHRTYSKRHAQNVYQDHAGGGGPGGQHCYTMGLALYASLTGQRKAKECVIGLTEWISNIYEGDNTLVGLALALKNRYRTDLKNPLSGQYPLDRGTANYLNALMDSFELTHNEGYLNRAFEVIQHTATAQDELGQRDLANVEETWFYTVFLQGVCRFVALTEHQADMRFFTARATLLHYANWMANNEYNYLDKPDILEYPNQTWTAQDLRKVCVLSCAAHYADEEDAQRFLTKAVKLKHNIVVRLQQDPTAYYTRILALLMQNYAVDTYFERPPWQANSSQTPTILPPTPAGLSLAVRETLRNFSITREWQQFKKRFLTQTP